MSEYPKISCLCLWPMIGSITKVVMFLSHLFKELGIVFPYVSVSETSMIFFTLLSFAIKSMVSMKCDCLSMTLSSTGYDSIVNSPMLSLNDLPFSSSSDEGVKFCRVGQPFLCMNMARTDCSSLGFSPLSSAM